MAKRLKDPRQIDQILYDDLPEEGLSMSAYARHREAATLVGHSYQTVKKAFDSGRITKNKFGKFDVRQTDIDWFNNTDQRRDPLQHAETVEADLINPPTDMLDDNDIPPYQISQARKEHANARIQELKLEEAEGLLINKTEAYGEMFNVLRNIRDRIQNIPVLVSPNLVGLEELAEVEHVLSDKIREVLEELTQDIRRMNQIED